MLFLVLDFIIHGFNVINDNHELKYGSFTNCSTVRYTFKVLLLLPEFPLGGHQFHQCRC